ncbi:unnamed protein product [Rhizophagus irregularis]|nr:unnamed protein product [Rhizophagus irregularis]
MCSTLDLGYSSGMVGSECSERTNGWVREYPVLDTGPETVYNRIRWFSIRWIRSECYLRSGTRRKRLKYGCYEVYGTKHRRDTSKAKRIIISSAFRMVLKFRISVLELKPFQIEFLARYFLISAICSNNLQKSVKT